MTPKLLTVVLPIAARGHTNPLLCPLLKLSLSLESLLQVSSHLLSLTPSEEDSECVRVVGPNTYVLFTIKKGEANGSGIWNRAMDE